MNKWYVVIGGLIGLSIAGAIASKWHKENQERDKECLKMVDDICQKALEEVKSECSIRL